MYCPRNNYAFGSRLWGRFQTFQICRAQTLTEELMKSLFGLGILFSQIHKQSRTQGQLSGFRTVADAMTLRLSAAIPASAKRTVGRLINSSSNTRWSCVLLRQYCFVSFTTRFHRRAASLKSIHENDRSDERPLPLTHNRGSERVLFHQPTIEDGPSSSSAGSLIRR